MIIGKLKAPPIGKADSMVLQAWRFDKRAGWSLSKAKQWYSTHGKDFKPITVEGTGEVPDDFVLEIAGSETELANGQKVDSGSGVYILESKIESDENLNEEILTSLKEGEVKLLPMEKNRNKTGWPPLAIKLYDLAFSVGVGQGLDMDDADQEGWKAVQRMFKISDEGNWSFQENRSDEVRENLSADAELSSGSFVFKREKDGRELKEEDFPFGKVYKHQALTTTGLHNGLEYFKKDLMNIQRNAPLIKLGQGDVPIVGVNHDGDAHNIIGHIDDVYSLSVEKTIERPEVWTIFGNVNVTEPEAVMKIERGTWRKFSTEVVNDKTIGRWLLGVKVVDNPAAKRMKPVGKVDDRVSQKTRAKGEDKKLTGVKGLVAKFIKRGDESGMAIGIEEAEVLDEKEKKTVGAIVREILNIQKKEEPETPGDEDKERLDALEAEMEELKAREGFIIEGAKEALTSKFKIEIEELIAKGRIPAVAQDDLLTHMLKMVGSFDDLHKEAFKVSSGDKIKYQKSLESLAESKLEGLRGFLGKLQSGISTEIVTPDGDEKPSEGNSTDDKVDVETRKRLRERRREAIGRKFNR
jgi:hypothetical protein